MHLHSFKTMNKGIKYTIEIFLVFSSLFVVVAAVLPSLWGWMLYNMPYPIGGLNDPNGSPPAHAGILGRLAQYGLYGSQASYTAWIVITIALLALVVVDIYGIFLAKPWARTLAILISIPMIAGILMGLGTLWYLLTQPNGRRYFGLPVTQKEDAPVAQGEES